MGLRPWRSGRPDFAMPRLSLSPPEVPRRVARFLVVGGGSTLLQLALLAGLKAWFNPTVAFSISWVASTAAHYLANRFWALPSERHDTGRQYGEYLFTVALSYAINVAAFKLGRDGLGLSVMWAAFWSIPPSTVVVFLMLNYRVFRPGRGEG